MGLKNQSRRVLKPTNSVPMLNYKNSILLMLFLFISFQVGIGIIEFIPRNFLVLAIIVTSFVIGYGMSLIQIKLQNKSKLGKSFVWLGLMFSILVFIMLFSVYFAAVLI